MQIIRTISAMRAFRAGLDGLVALVPTMGALHAGHRALIDAARSAASHVIVSIFVNPTQFGEHEDFDRYPRPIDDDLAQCKAAGVAAVFVPTVAEMYPPDAIASDLTVPTLSGVLEGASRPGHFNGVCRVVAKLFHIVQPNVAIFGQKDYQQYRVIAAFAADLNMPLEVRAHPTIRDEDGLALSSRNVYLTPTDRVHALGLYKALCEARMLIREAGEVDPSAVEQAMRAVLLAHHVAVDYAVVRDARTLAPLDALGAETSAVALVAGRVGGVRLIDNMVIA